MLTMLTMLNCWRRVLVHNEASKVLELRTKKVAGLFKLLQLLIISHALVTFVWYKRYQNKDIGVSTVKTELKGKPFVNFTNFSSSMYKGKHDPSDYKPPPPQKKDGYCEIYGLCSADNNEGTLPGHNSTTSPHLVDFTRGINDTRLLVKNQVWFPKFNVRRRNMNSASGRDYLDNCTYSKDPDCPRFTLEDIVNSCGDNITTVAAKGAIYAVIIIWDCDLDYSVEQCNPTYKFKRVDDDTYDITSSNEYKFTQHDDVDSVSYKTLTNAYGLKFHVVVKAKAGRFALERLFVEFAILIARVLLCKWFCHLVMLFCADKTEGYKTFFNDGDDDDDEFDV